MKALVLGVLAIVSDAGAFEGHAITGFFELSGALKQIVDPGAFPIGSIQSSYGYEVWDLSASRGLNLNQNRATLCSSAVELTLNSKVFGVGFGANSNRIRTIGRCEGRASQVAGEELIIHVAIDPLKGWKNIPVVSSFRFSLSVGKLLDHLERYFKSTPGKFTRPARLRRLFKHMLLFLPKPAMAGVAAAERVLFRMLLAALLGLGRGDSPLSISKTEFDLITRFKPQASFSEFPTGLLEIMYKSPSFYQSHEPHFSEIALDFVQFKEAFIDALFDNEFCHNRDLAIGAGSGFSLELPRGGSIQLGIGYGISRVDRVYTSEIPPRVLAAYEYASHRFRTHSEECQDLSNEAGRNFARLVKLFQDGLQ